MICDDSNDEHSDLTSKLEILQNHNADAYCDWAGGKSSDGQLIKLIAEIDGKIMQVKREIHDRDFSKKADKIINED